MMKPVSTTAILDSDDAPALTQEDFERARFRVGQKDVSREEWRKAARVHLSESQHINITLDQDVLNWLKEQANEHEYQTLINIALREAMQRQTLETVLRRIIREELTHH
jgi:uncharacterized protein (DUF4415 family)